MEKSVMEDSIQALQALCFGYGAYGGSLGAVGVRRLREGIRMQSTNGDCSSCRGSSGSQTEIYPWLMNTQYS